MDAGGLAQMSSFSNLPGSDFNVPRTGFTSRRGSAIKSLSFDQSKISSTIENAAPTPRTSRSHLLAGLRTAPRNTTTSLPMTAPPSQIEHNVGVRSRYSENINYDGVRTSNLVAQQLAFGQICNNQVYPTTEHILAPPDIHVDEHGYDQLDPNYYAHLVATNMYLAEQQQRLQQQLYNVQAAAQQFQGMSLAAQQYSMSMATSSNLYQLQMKNNMQMPPRSSSSGVNPMYPCYNTSMSQNVHNQNDQQRAQLDQLQAVQSIVNYSTQRSNISPRPRTSMMPADSGVQPLNSSPPTKPQSPVFDLIPLPPPSAGAFRRGHRKSPSSLVISSEENIIDTQKASVMSKMTGASPAVLSGFGPGQGRIGEHPVRQPRGPPSIDILIARPTAKYEGTKNFASRARRCAVNNLVRAGIERRKAPGSIGSGSISLDSEVSEVQISLTDNESDSGHSGSGSLSSRPALGSPRTSIHGAIGSNRPSSRQRLRNLERKSITSLDSSFTSASFSGDESNYYGSNVASVIKNGRKQLRVSELELKAPKLILTPVDNFKNHL